MIVNYSHIDAEELAATIETLQNSLNDGRGISAARTVVAYLRIGNISKAAACVNNEYDKFEFYPELREVLAPLKKMSEDSEIE